MALTAFNDKEYEPAKVKELIQEFTQHLRWLIIGQYKVSEISQHHEPRG